MPEFMKVPKVLGNAPTGRRSGTPVTSQGHSGDANSRALVARDRAQASAPGVQQRNEQARQAEANRYAAAARMKRGAPAQKSGLLPPAGPSVSQAQMATPSQGLRSALTRVRTAKRLTSLLRRR